MYFDELLNLAVEWRSVFGDLEETRRAHAIHHVPPSVQKERDDSFFFFNVFYPVSMFFYLLSGWLVVFFFWFFFLPLLFAPGLCPCLCRPC